MEEPIEDIKFQTTKEGCQSAIDRDGYVCPGCGGKPEPLQTEDNAGNPTFWAACLTCNIFTWGVPSICFEIAKKMIYEGYYTHYKGNKPRPNKEDLDKPENQYWLQSNLQGTSNHVAGVLRYYSQITGNKITDY